MKHIIQTVLLALALATGLTASAQTTTLTNFPVGMMIPDDSPAGLASAKIVSTPITYLTGLKVTLKVSGTFNGDLYCYLTHGSGHTVLLNRVGRRSSSSLGYSDSGLDVKFDDAATNGDIHVYRLTLNGNNTTPLSGALTNVWAPDARTNSPYSVLDTDPRAAFLSSFNGSDPNGQWVLFIADAEGGDISILDNWGLELTGYSAPSITTTTAVSTSENPALPTDNVTFTALITAHGAGSAVPTGTVQFKTNGVDSGAAVTLSSGQGSLTLAASDLGHGSFTITAAYTNIDGKFTNSTGTLSLNQVVNQPPYAFPVFFATPLNTAMTVAAADVASANYDPDGDSLSVTLVDATSAHGGAVSLSGGTITYTPTATFVGTDTFSYTVSDPFNGTASATATVSVGLDKYSSSIGNMSVENGVGTHLIGYGIPGNTYNIQKSTDLTNWGTLGTATAGTDGIILFTDPATTGTRFYRFQMQ